MFKTFPIVLDITKHQLNDMFQVNSNDLNTVRLNLSIKSGLEIFDLTGKIVRIAIKKPDGFIAFQTGGVTDPSNGLCEFLLDRQAYLVEGKHEAEVMIYQDDSTVIVTERFYYKVNRAIVNDKTLLSTNHLPAINQAIIAGEQLKDIDIPEFVEAANSAYETIEEAETQGLYAKGQGDYAKQEADRAAARVTELNGVDAVQFKGRQDQFDIDLLNKGKKGEDVPANVKDYGAIGDGNSHPLSETYSTLASAQVKYPSATALTDEKDWCAIQYTINTFNKTFVPQGGYNLNKTIVMRDNTHLFLEGANARQINGSKCAVLYATTNIDIISLGDGSTVKGGIVTPFKVSGFTKSCIKLDFSTGIKYNNKIETSLIGTGVGYGVHLYGNGNGGEAFGAEIKGFISFFDTGIKGEKLTGTSWYTGLFVDAFIMNCLQAINTNVGSGGRLSGTFQPKLGATGTFNTETRALIELDAPNILVDGFIWDMNTAINKHDIHLKPKAMFPQLLTATTLYLKNELKYPYNKINMIEQTYDSATLFPSRPKTLRNSFAGMQDNILLGAHKKFTVTRTYDNSLIYLYNGNGCFLGDETHTEMQLYGSAPKNIDTPLTYEIVFDSPKHFHFMGFSFQGGYYPYYYKMYRKIGGVYSVVKEGNPNTTFYDGKNNWSQHTAITTGRVAGDSDEPFVEAIKFEFIFNPNLDGKELLRLTNLFYKDGTVNKNFLPAYGGSLYGDLEFSTNASGTIMKSPDGSRFRLTIGNDGALTTTKL